MISPIDLVPQSAKDITRMFFSNFRPVLDCFLVVALYGTVECVLIVDVPKFFPFDVLVVTTSF